jgi:hypothetical protein
VALATRRFERARALLCAALLGVTACSTQEFPLGSGPPPAEPFSLSQFRAEWSTPSQVRWAWQTRGEPVDFGGFRLVLAGSRAEVEERADTCRIITADENVELGDWILPGSDGPARTRGTTSDQHAPETTWFARLEWMSDGTPAVSEVASAVTTAGPSAELSILEDAAPSPYTIPDTFVLASNAPFSGTSNYQYASDCAGVDSCWENLRFAEMDFDLATVPESALISTGYLAFAVAYRGSAASYWSELFVQLRDCAPCRYGFVGWAIPADDQYRIYEVPLAALKRDGESMPFSAWQSGLTELRIGGNWSEGGLVRIDRVSLHW